MKINPYNLPLARRFGSMVTLWLYSSSSSTGHLSCIFDSYISTVLFDNVRYFFITMWNQFFQPHSCPQDYWLLHRSFVSFWFLFLTIFLYIATSAWLPLLLLFTFTLSNVHHSLHVNWVSAVDFVHIRTQTLENSRKKSNRVFGPGFEPQTEKLWRHVF